MIFAPRHAFLRAALPALLVFSVGLHAQSADAPPPPAPPVQIAPDPPPAKTLRPGEIPPVGEDLPDSTWEQDCKQDSPLRIVPSLPHSKHPPARGDYLVLIYDAQHHKASWLDYSDVTHWYQKPHLDPHVVTIDGQSSLIPIVYTREKIAVHVCNLHFTDTITVSTSPVAVPEGGADIRGVTPTTAAPVLTPSSDLLAGSSSTGSALSTGSVVWGNTTAVTPSGIAGYVPGVITPAKAQTDHLTYTDASITISAQQLAILMAGVVENARSMRPTITELITGNSQPGDQFASAGSIVNLGDQANQLFQRLVRNGNPNLPRNQNNAAFVDDVTAVGSLVNQLSGLNSVLTAQTLGARAVTLNQSYAALHGVLDLVENIIHTDEPAIRDGCPTVLFPPAYDTPDCRYYEWQSFSRFKRDYCHHLREFDPNVDDQRCLTWGETEIRNNFHDLQTLHGWLLQLDTTVAKIFAIMNTRYDRSRIDVTDLLTPPTANSLVRISIIVQRTFTPFTFSSAPSAGPVTTSAGGGAPSAGGSGSGGSGSGASSGSSSGGSSPAASAAATSVSSASNTAESAWVEIHRRSNFNFVGGAMVIWVPTKSFTVVSQTTGSPTSSQTSTMPYSYTYSESCNKGPTVTITTATTTPQNFYCIVPSQTSSLQVAGMAGVEWFAFHARDYFPYKSGYAFRWDNFYPAALLATSVTSLGNVFIGPNIEPVNGIDVFFGRATANQTALPSALTTQSVLQPGGSGNTPPTLPTTTNLRWGWSFGIGFDFGVFTQIFSKPSVASLP